MKYLLAIDGRMAIVPFEKNEREIMHLKESSMLIPDCWVFPIMEQIPNRLSELSSITEHGRVRFTTSKDDYEFFRSFFDCIDIVLNNSGGNK